MQQEHLKSTPLGFIPAGTGNSLCRHLECVEPLEAARRVIAGNEQPLDVIRVTVENEVLYCVNIVGWGAVVDINSTAERLRVLGPSRYTGAAIVHVLRSKHRRAKLVFDGKIVEEAYLLCLSRLPTERERNDFVALLGESSGNEKREAVEDLFWALMNTPEFLFID